MKESYLNKTGLAYFYGRLLNIFSTKTDTTASLSTKVDKADGMGLSQNSYTTTEKTKLSGISTGAQVNILEGVKVNGSLLTVTNKSVNVTVPTNTNQLTNGANFQNETQVLAAITSATTASLSTKVDKADGMGLSQNSYTTTEKTKLSGISTGAQVNILEGVKVNGSLLTVTNKSVNVTVPTNTNQLINGSNFQNEKQVLAAITSALSDITSIKFEVVASLPTTGVDGTIYLLSNSGTAPNIYDEFIYVNGSWEKIGTTAVDLSGYWAKVDLTAITTEEIDTITA